jgi:glycosyltransferase involved in cell wall biosynthesis
MPRSGGAVKISFLVHHVYGIGGTVRAVANLAGGLAERHVVEIVSVYRTRDVPEVRIDPRVRVVPLVDARVRGWRYRSPLSRLPSRMPLDPGPAASTLPPSRLTDRRVARYLRRTDADVVIATRPVLVCALAASEVPPGCLRIGQEHRTLASHPEELRREYLAAVARLDGYAAVSGADAAQWRAALPPEASVRVAAIPNAVPQPGVAPSTGDAQVVLAAGRFIPVKRYDRLIRAFARVAARRPGWELRLYGRGRKEQSYRWLIDRLGVGDRVRLMGAVSPIEPEWAKGAIAAVTSDEESFGMTIVEAMRCGVPVIATDCPHGPREILRDGENGVLVPLDEGTRGFARALLRLMDDAAARRRLGAAALRDAARYDPSVIAARYEEWFGELSRAGTGSAYAADGRPQARTGGPPGPVRP